jgi:hypothetical protein
MLDLNKYSNSGWGISVKGFEALTSALDSLGSVNAIEFGSGFSTQFLIDYAEQNKKEFLIDSFDNDEQYKHEASQLVELIQCKDKDYEAMFESQKLDWSAFKKRFWRPKTRQKNCFYRIDESKLKSNYNVAIVDGPHGNGRNFAYLLLKSRMTEGFIFIDDFNHYDFVERASSVFNLKEVCRVETKGDNFVLMEIEKK